MITLNEEDRIGACLASVPFASERLVLDCGSTDRTVACAGRAGARVVSTDWPGFSAQRNRALDLVQAPFVLFLDADERLSAGAMRAVLDVLESSGADGWTLKRQNHFGGRAIRHGLWYPDRQLRLVRAGRGRWEGAVHERLRVDGRVEHIDQDVLHAPYRSLQEHLAAMDSYARLAATEMVEQGMRARPWDPVLHGAWYATRSLVLRGGWRDGSRGVAVAGLGAAASAMKWHRVRCASS